MSFISAEFALFFCAFALVYFAAAPRWRPLILLAGGLFFYAQAGLAQAGLLVAGTLIDFVLARAIGATGTSATGTSATGTSAAGTSGRRRAWLLAAGLAHNVGALVLFKLWGAAGGVVPLGVSFYTFVRVAYLLDVARRKSQPETDIVAFAGFATFFPTIASGPIERAEHLLPQIKAAPGFDAPRAADGLRLILWGAFKKVVIADRLALYVSAVYGAPAEQHGLALLAATVFLAFQIYADFSGYTDMARGVGRVLGFELFENFRQPYLAKSILDFWRRWHISLTSWIREYLFFPLTRMLLKRTERRYPRAVEVASYVVIMGVVGLWHGASWPFLAWGLLHGLAMGVESLLNARRITLVPQNRATDALKVATTFAIVCLGWVFFRSASMAEALQVLGGLVRFEGDFAASFAVYGAGFPGPLLINAGLVALLAAADWADARWGLLALFARLPIGARFAAYYTLIGAVLAAVLAAQTVQTFVYFQF